MAFINEEQNMMLHNQYKVLEVDKLDFEYKKDDRSLFFIEENFSLLRNEESDHIHKVDETSINFY